MYLHILQACIRRSIDRFYILYASAETRALRERVEGCIRLKKVWTSRSVEARGLVCDSELRTAL